MSAIELVSPLPPDECEARLRALTGPDFFSSWLGTRAVVGQVSGQSIRLRKGIVFRNSFQTCLTGTLEARGGGGTVFRGRAGVHPFVSRFMVVWFSVAGLIGIPIMLAAAAGLVAGEARWVGLVIPPLLVAGGFGVFRLGRWLALGEEQFLVAFVAQAISATGEEAAEPRACTGTGRQ